MMLFPSNSGNRIRKLVILLMLITLAHGLFGELTPVHALVIHPVVLVCLGLWLIIDAP